MKRYRHSILLHAGTCFGAILLGFWGLSAQQKDYFKIRGIDEATGRGVPLMELKTISEFVLGVINVRHHQPRLLFIANNYDPVSDSSPLLRYGRS
ncbi:MAG: hypothetical protein JST84_25130 [Acidobacteria bacterium]|nr:hypothetical protein [Acidobacteriota bacterium]